MPQTTDACRTCADPRYDAVTQSVERGLSLRNASIAAGLRQPHVSRHRRRCPAFRERLDSAEDRGREERRRSHRPQSVERALPIIAAALATGASRAEAAERAGIQPSHERAWRARYPSYREAVEDAEQTGATR